MATFSEHDFGQARTWTGRGSGSRLNFVYLALATVNLLTVAAAVYVGYCTLELIADRVNDARIWSAKQSAVHRLADTAQSVFSPANEVFLSLDASGERDRLAKAVAAFDLSLAQVRKAIQPDSKKPAEVAARAAISERVNAIERFVRQGALLGRVIMDRFEENDSGASSVAGTATGLMTQSDRLAGRVDDLVNSIAEDMANAFIRDLTATGKNAEQYRKSLAIFGALMILIVVATFAYGLNLSRVLKASSLERERQLLDIAARERQLESKNEELARTNDSIAAIVQRAQEGIEAVSEGYALFDKDYRLVQWNAKIEQCFPMYAGRLQIGTSALDLLLWSIEDAEPGDTAAEAGWIDRRAAIHESLGVPFEQRISGRIWQLTEYRTKEGGLVIIHRDVTDIRAAGEKLKDQVVQLNVALETGRIANQRARDAISALDVGFSLFDADDRLLLWNAMYEDIIPGFRGRLTPGISAKELAKLAYDLASQGDDCRKPEWWKNRAAARETLGLPFEMIVGGRTLEIVERRTAEGGIVAIHRDVTDARAQQAELNQAKIEAELASEAKTHFLANMSHEIRTPLNGVIGMTEILLESHLSAEQRMQVEIARSAADQLLQVIGNILDISKLESGAIELESAPFDLAPLIENAVQTVTTKAHAKGLEVTVYVDEVAEGWYLGDSTRLSQVLLNLLYNAVKFTDRGAVSITCRGRPAGANMATLAFVVQDTGVGMAEEQVSKLFQKFVQADSSITRRFGGTGLGLAISKQLVETMGGKITVDSHIGRGSSFSFELRLPLAEGARSYDPKALVGKRVLVVDDLELNRSLLSDRLARWGMIVDVALDADRAIEALSAPGPAYDVAIIDRAMPGKDGAELGQEIRARMGASSPKLVLWSSMSNAGVIANAQTTKVFDASLFKPVQGKTLCETLTALLTGPADAELAPPDRAESDSRLADASILLVEDNETNQYAATTLLRQLGCTVTLAVNGRIAVEKCMAQRFDLILMDMQMPEMDGIAATRVIRSQRGPNAKTPILALTANAFIEDAERCRAAGMNEHLTKPLRKSVLTDALRRHLGARTPDASVHSQPLLATDTWAALLEDFGPQGLASLAATFESQQAAELQTMSADDRTDLRRKAHSLKGSAKLFGATSLAERAERLEAIALDAEPDEIAALTAAIMQDFALACSEIRRNLAA